MSYERALDEARAQIDRAAAPPWAAVDARLRWSVGAPRRLEARRPLAVLASVAATAVMAVDAAASHVGGAPLVAMLVVPVLVLAIATAAIVRGTVTAQLFARATWWTYLGLGVAWSFGPAEAVPVGGALLASCCGFALLAAGGLGMTPDAPGGSFDPSAFRGTLLLSMVLAEASAHVMLLIGGVRAESGASGAVPLAALAVAHLLAVGGLLRLRTWGLLGLPVVAVATMGAILAGGVAIGPILALVVLASSTALLALPLSILRALHRGVAPLPRRDAFPSRRSAAAVAIAMLTAIVASMLGSAGP